MLNKLDREAMNTCYYYLIVEPLLQEYNDDTSVEPAMSVLIKAETKEYRVSFYTSNNQLYMIRIEIPDVPDEVIPEIDLEPIQTIREHIVSVLRLTYDHEVSLFPRPLWNFIKEGQEPNLHIKIDKITNPNFTPHVANIRNVFVTTFPTRVQIKLLSDAQDARLPLQYRYLSLYKILEMEFKKRGKWTREYVEFVSGFEERFKNLGICMKPTNYIIYLRDRCAHIKTGKGMLGITQLSNKDMIEVNRFLPLMTEICAGVVNKKYRDKGFSLVDFEAFSREVSKQESSDAKQ